MAKTGKQKVILILLLAVLPVGSVLAVRMYLSRSGLEAAGPSDSSQPNAPGRQGPGGGRSGGANAQGGGGNPGGGFGGPGGGGFGGPGNRVPLVDTTTVTQGAVREQLALVGSLKPKEQVQVMARSSGKVEKVLVDVGDMVQEGQLLATLEGDELDQQVLRSEASLAVAEATLAQRQAELENAKADQARTAQLAAEGLVSIQSQDSAQTRVRVVEAQLKLAEAQVRAAQADLAELKIRQQQGQIVSPLTGWIAQRSVDPGALVGTNTPLLSVLRLSSLITEVRVPEQYLADMHIGNRAVVFIDALGGKAVEGRVARISPMLDAATRSGLVQVEIPNTNDQLKAEMSARIQMDVGAERQALLVPSEAVVVRGMQTGVHVLQGNRVHFTPVQTGISTDKGVEIVSGLAQGTTVVTKGSQNLQDGSTVETPASRAAAEDRS